MALVDNDAALVSGLVGEVVGAGQVGLDFEVDEAVVALDFLETETLIAPTVGMRTTVLTVIQVDNCLGLPPIIIVNNCVMVTHKQLCAYLLSVKFTVKITICQIYVFFDLTNF